MFEDVLFYLDILDQVLFWMSLSILCFNFNRPIASFPKMKKKMQYFTYFQLKIDEEILSAVSNWISFKN